MKKSVWSFVLVLSVLAMNSAMAQEQEPEAPAGDVLLLRVSKEVIEQGSRTATKEWVAEFYGCTADPNWGVACNPRFLLDGVEQKIPSSVIWDLIGMEGRRSFSYDIQSGGLQDDNDKGAAVCTIGGPSAGLVVETLYLAGDYSAGWDKAKMQVVSSYPLTCHYLANRIYPKDQYASENAHAVARITNALVSVLKKTDKK